MISGASLDFFELGYSEYMLFPTILFITAIAVAVTSVLCFILAPLYSGGKNKAAKIVANVFSIIDLIFAIILFIMFVFSALVLLASSELVKDDDTVLFALGYMLAPTRFGMQFDITTYSTGLSIGFYALYMIPAAILGIVSFCVSSSARTKYRAANGLIRGAAMPQGAMPYQYNPYQQNVQQGYPQQYQQNVQQGYSQQYQQNVQQGYPQQYQQNVQQGYPQQYQQNVQQGYPQQYQQNIQQGYPQQYQQNIQQSNPQYQQTAAAVAATAAVASEATPITEPVASVTESVAEAEKQAVAVEESVSEQTVEEAVQTAPAEETVSAENTTSAEEDFGKLLDDEPVAQPAEAVPEQVKEEAPVQAEPASFCVNCGQPIMQGTAFCANCGHRVNGVKTAVCTGCGAKLAEGAMFCTNCGKRAD